ncbi:hypothetical protein PG985_005842 [Apiospora marii]|uniref:uncharacterized protein n=1 Tax=Apiospora marii TaxID=335849 RepID=UPI0031308F6C
MFSRSAALRSGVQYARIYRRWRLHCGHRSIYTFLMGNPDKAQEVGGQYHPQAQSTEDKFKQRPDVRLEGPVSPAPGAK